MSVERTSSNFAFTNGVLDSAPSYQQLYKNTLPPLVIAFQLPYRLQTLINASLSLVIRRTQATVIVAAHETCLYHAQAIIMLKPWLAGVQKVFWDM